ncbi:MAG: Ig-like domain-containing protein, partial [Anaerolineales bacterium]
PDIPGTWQWVGTRTLRFNFDSELIDRLPMATRYTVTVPAGTKSASGSELAEAVTWEFRTPPPTITQSFPNYGPQDLDPFIFVAFDQRIDPQAVLATISLTADNNPVSISLADEDAYTEDEIITRMVENSPEGRWLVFQADESLPKDANIVVTIGPETPSAEGPLATTGEQSFSFYTYPPLKIESQDCGWYTNNEKCYPLSPFYIRFNNPLDPDLYTDNMISIDPVIPGATVSIMGNTITISGPTEGNTTYRVTVDESITDTFGQQLGRDERLTFKVGEAEPMLYGPEDILVTLDPAAPSPALSLYTINYDSLDVQIYAVEPADWPAFKIYMQDYARTDQPPSPPGLLVRDERINIDAESDSLAEVSIDLSDVMDGDFGHFIVIAKPPSGFFEEDRYWETVHAWVQVTQIGLDAIADQEELVAWATALKDGSPLEGITISSNTGKLSATTDVKGIAKFDLSGGISFLTARSGDDIAFLPRSTYYWGDDNWTYRPTQNSLAWYVFDDRAMYRPGEDVNLKGWIRLIDNSPEGDVELLDSRTEAVNYTVIGPQGNDLLSGSAPLNATGGFDFSFTIPEEVNLGYAQVYFTLPGSSSGADNTQYYHSFQIQEFRRPEFEVTARNETTGPYFVDGEATVAVEAAYYAGGPLPSAETNWSVSSSPTNYQPPNWPDFTFGTWTPWWYYGGPIYEADYFYGGPPTNTSYETFSGLTDATGNHYLTMTFENTGEPRPYTINANASVMDVNRQAWAGSTNLLVHPSNRYVGMHTNRYFVDKNTPINVDLIVTDLDGNAQEDLPINVRAARMEWKYENGKWQEVEATVQECTATSQL